MKILLSLLLVCVSFHRIQAFAPNPVMTPRGVSNGIIQKMANFSPEEKDDDAIAIQAPVRKGLTPIQQAFSAITDAASVGIIAVGAYATLGFMLNTCGYALQITSKHGVEIEPIGKMREINQFRAAVSNSRPPSALPK